MADEEGPKSPFHAIGAALVALLGGLATVADDCGRAAVHVGGATDDLARVGAHVDDGANALDDLARGAHLDPHAAVPGLGALDDAANAADGFVADLASYGLDAAEIGLDVYDLAAASGSAGDAPAPASPKRPRLVVAGIPNPPADEPADPLVLLVEDTDEARLARLAEGCATVDRRCHVIACAPGDTACRDAWRAAWDTLATDPALVGHPEAVWDALILTGTAHPATRGARLFTSAMTPTGRRSDARRAR